ncbi:MAG: hypothetical protein NTW17_03650 [Candidatus Pacearchaeota archaeon]|nr:hypothetical protein [Candidatus Pacearchaeota archaeon]
MNNTYRFILRQDNSGGYVTEVYHNREKIEINHVSTPDWLRITSEKIFSAFLSGRLTTLLGHSHGCNELELKLSKKKII